MLRRVSHAQAGGRAWRSLSAGEFACNVATNNDNENAVEEGMDARTRADQLRAASNPLFNDRNLKLGTFCSNLSGGATMSSIDGILQAKWPDTLTLARM